MCFVQIALGLFHMLYFLYVLSKLYLACFTSSTLYCTILLKADRKKAIENRVGKGENDSDQQFSFPHNVF